jgi:hypothetical protein
MFTPIKRFSMVLLLVGIAILFSAATQAQPQRMSVEERVKILKDSLNLNDAQSAKITKILEDQREEMTTIMSENQGDRDAMRTAMQETIEKADNKIKLLLSDKQLAKYEAMLKQRKARMERRMRDGGRK